MPCERMSVPIAGLIPARKHRSNNESMASLAKTEQVNGSEWSGNGQEPPLRYHLARRLVGVPTFAEYTRTLVGGALYFGAPLILARLLAKRGQRKALHQLERWWSRRVFQHLQIIFDVEGLEHIDPHTAYLVAPLHEGFADVPALLHLPLNLRFAARDELFGWRLLGSYLSDTGQLLVEPERGARSYRRLLRTAAEVFAAGESLVIFPQGTILGIETEFLRGAFALAKALERPILPIALTGSHRVWEHPYNPRLRYGQRISLRVLNPLSVDEVRMADIGVLRLAVQRSLKAAALDGTMARPRRFVPERDGYWDGYAYRIDPDFPELAAQIEHHRQMDRMQFNPSAQLV